MAEMRELLLVLLCVTHSSASCGVQKASHMDPSEEESLVDSTEFPWVVSVQDAQYTHLAFGCILSEFWVLSSASAFQNRQDAVVVVGIANMDSRRIAHTEYPVNTIIIHEDFDNSTMNNNIALLKTDSEMHFDDLVNSICFLGKKLHMPPVFHNCWVSGWNPTSATGNHMTMSILRRISVKDIDLCPLPKLQKTGCGSHTQQETDDVCLGEPGSPMMCQLQQLDLWVLKGILTHGGDSCPGVFLYTKVEDYSNWIMSRSRRAGPPLSSLHPWEKLIPIPFHESHHRVTQTTYSVVSYVEPSQTYTQGPTSTALSRPANGSKSGQNLRVKGLQADRPVAVGAEHMYYDYYGGEAGEGGLIAGQDKLHRPPEVPVILLVLLFFGSGA